MSSTPEERSARSRAAARALWGDHVPAGQAERSRRWYAKNRSKQRAAQQQWRLENPEEAQERDQRYYRENRDRVLEANLRRNHGIRPEDVVRMYEAQQGKCYLCGDLLPADRAKWPIDHDHRHCPPGKSCRYCRRGISCSPCNLLIGKALDSPERLRRIADSLEAAITDVTHRLAEQAVQGELFELREAGEFS